ncbi:hypothetical protein GCM10011343_25320 [Flavobacterium orientale]|uniref:RHS repeat-associated core domain-containing protein n=1 Tax=Flavobacterium orientale TaxID=1756020 RepID=A0A916Y7J8_9FLAO|nr:hypothetical protein GCM10011343_25320 [Flavobacterium orientale]
MPNRHGSAESYRYGFQGQEKDDEVKGEGNSLNYTFRMHDPRVGRFFAVDPLASEYPWYSPYSFSGNRVLDMVELEGLEPAHSNARANRPSRMRPAIKRVNNYLRGGSGGSYASMRAVNRVLGFSPSFRIKNTIAQRNAERNMNEFIAKYNLNPRTFNSQTGEPNPSGVETKHLENLGIWANFINDLKENYNLSVKKVEIHGRIEETNTYISVSSEYQFDGIMQFKLTIAESAYQKVFNQLVVEKLKDYKDEDLFGTNLTSARLTAKIELGPSPVELVNRIFEEAKKNGDSKEIMIEVKELPVFNQGY